MSSDDIPDSKPETEPVVEMETEGEVVVEEPKLEDAVIVETEAEKKEKEVGTVTPRERPSRERKAVDRYWIATPRNSAVKPLSIEKGSGTPLRDIPNVAFKMSKAKPDDNLQLLHMILFGRKAKVHSLKRDIGQFSGFVWIDNEEKQRAKMKEKIDKCVKEKLLHFCDVLNIPVNKSSVKKEDLTVKLLEFLECPHATTEELLAAKDQKGKNQKRKATPSKSRVAKAESSEKSAKKTQSGEKRKRTSKADEDVETENKDEEMETRSHSSEEGEEVEEEDVLEKQESDGEQTESEEEKDVSEEQATTPKSSSKVNSGTEGGKKSKSTKKPSPDKPTKSPAKSETKTVVTSKKAAAEASGSSSKAKGSSNKKQKAKEDSQKETPVPAEEKSASKKRESKPAPKEKAKGKTKKDAKKEPSTDELRGQAVNILKEVDFNTATLSDILRLLGNHFGVDLMHRKVEVKAIITDVIENMSNSDDDDADDDSDDEDAEDSGKE